MVFFSIDADPADMDSVDMGGVRGRIVSPRLCSGGVPGGVPDNVTTQHIAILVCFLVNHSLMIILSSNAELYKMFAHKLVSRRSMNLYSHGGITSWGSRCNSDN